MDEKAAVHSNFILDAIDEDLKQGRAQRVHTRFPPEPNGYLHIGHCKALITNFGIAEKYGGLCNLRFDDTNPAKEDHEYVEGIMEDIHWLGFDWGDRLYYGSDYFEKTYELAVDLIRKGLAYVCQLSPEEFKAHRGDVGVPATSPYRDRPIAESLDLFQRMRGGEFPEGSMTLRAKIDLSSGNFNMRDPVIYRIRYIEHHRQGTKWCIFPMYDFAHPIQDALEGITHSLCSLEYEDHRPLYNWVIEHTAVTAKPRQIEFARLNLTRTIMSKRYLRRLVEEGYVSGWDDPRMPTLCALRRRGYTPQAIRGFIEQVGLSKADSVADLALLEHCVRDDLGGKSPRVMAVLRPLKVVLTNWPENRVEMVEMENHPEHPEMGTRQVAFTRELYVERDDFMEVPPKKFFRLFPGGEVRLKGAYIIRCESCEKDENGQVTKLNCTVDLNSRSGTEGAARKVKGTLHWISAKEGVPFEARLYEPLLNDEEALEEDESGASEKKDFISRLNKDSLVVVKGVGEPALKNAKPLDTFQFLRTGYFCMDKDSTPDLPVFNRTVGLKDSWSKAQK